MKIKNHKTITNFSFKFKKSSVTTTNYFITFLQTIEVANSY